MEYHKRQLDFFVKACIHLYMYMQTKYLSDKYHVTKLCKAAA